MLMVPLAFLRVLDCRGIISLDLRNLPWNVVLMTLFLIPLTVILFTGLRGLRATR